jgi:multiple sugar transport system ATP-binding protein
VIEETGSDIFAHLAYDSSKDGDTILSSHDSSAPESDAAETPFFVVRLDATSQLREGKPGKLWLNTSGLHLFDPETGNLLPTAGKAAEVQPA